MTYKEALTNEMETLARNPKTLFLGYNCRYGHEFNGTLSTIPKSQRIELPVAENLIVGLGIGLALEGFQPVILIERLDFLWACADAIVNHLDKAPKLGWPPLKVIIRTCVGATSPLNPGCQHTGNYVKAFTSALSAPVLAAKLASDISRMYKIARETNGPVIIVEYRSLYDTPVATAPSSKLKKARLLPRTPPPKLVRRVR